MYVDGQCHLVRMSCVLFGPLHLWSKCPCSYGLFLQSLTKYSHNLSGQLLKLEEMYSVHILCYWDSLINIVLLMKNDIYVDCRMVCITCVLHEPITGQCVQRAGNMEEVIFWDKTTAAIPLWPSTWIIYLWLNLLVNKHKWSIHRPPSSRWG